MDSLTLAIAVGLIVSLMFSEFYGLAAGGMVVPGYIAISLDTPLTVVMTVLAGFFTFVVVSALGSVIIVYGRRRTVLMILVGYVVGALVRAVLDGAGLPAELELTVIGYIIPGLIGIWMDRQGTVETVSTMMSAAVVVRLTLLLFGVELAS